ncbi:MAG: HupE/UreJ family protein [Acidobacteria bacterium]|nr:HupE/UreJ family protein [Acidobacteriota bacterium]
MNTLVPLRLAAALAWCLSANAHEIPAGVSVHIVLRPEGQMLRAAVRVPLSAVRDIEFPQTGAGYLDLDRLQVLLPDAASLWIGGFVRIEEDGRPLPKPRVAAVRVSLPSDRSFESFSTAANHIQGSRHTTADHLVANQVNFDALLEYPIVNAASPFAIHPNLGHFGARVVTVLRAEHSNGAVRAYQFEGDTGMIPLDPRWHQAAGRFVALGFEHILAGADHLVFLFCLIVPFRRARPLIGIVTAFTAAHSITLIASAYGAAPDRLWFPPLVEALIALSIVYMAVENMLGADAERRRWFFAFAFGLVHGFGFSFALRENLQFAGGHLLTSLLCFNVGVELGQLLVLAVLLPVLVALFRWAFAERPGVIVLSAFAAHTSWHWFAERGEVLLKFWR